MPAHGGAAAAEAAEAAEAASLVTRWRRTRHALVVELSGGVVQARFVDGCELLLCAAERALVWVDRAGDAARLPLGAGWPAAFLPTGLASVDKRLRYVTELLQRWDRAALATEG